MRLISLELHGFKSFADRTKINFDQGMTVIVGPNGSGKSNISDAIKWVLGELSAKNIRGVKLEDIIFGGTERRSPMGFAEVSITIDNTGENRIESDYDTITVTRRYFKSGDSEYFINEKSVRLKDIVDLFMNTGIGKTGYSIVGQGRIGEIISQKSEERRYIFEEAAGISKYRIRKTESEKKLSEINLNLERVTDIASMLEVRVGPLEEDAAKARAYLEIYEKKKECDVSLILYDIDSLAKQNEEFERSYIMAKHNLEIADSALNSINRRSDMLLTETEETKATLSDSRASLAVATEEHHSLESSLLLSKSNLAHTEEEISRLRERISELNDELSASNDENLGLSEKLAECERILAEKTEALETAKEILADADSTLYGLRTELQQTTLDKTSCEKNHVEKRIRLSALESTEKSIEDRILSIEDSFTGARAELEETERKIKLSEQKLDSLKSRIDDNEREKQALLASVSEISSKKASLASSLGRVRSDMGAKQSHIDTLRRMEEHFDGYQRSVKFVLDAAAEKKLDGICGPVSRIITVEPSYSTAIDSALGGNIQNIVTENETSAKNAIYYLKRAGAGRATFYPLTTVRPDRPRSDLDKILAKKGCIGLASSLVSFDKKYEGVVTFLLGKTFVFDTLDNAEDAAKSTGQTIRAVTLDGQIINAGGSYTGGSAGKGSGMLTRASDIAALIKELEALGESEASLSNEIEKLDSLLSEKQSELENIAEMRTIITSLCTAEETSLSMLTRQQSAQKDQLAVLSESEEHVNQQKQAGAQLRSSIEADIIRLEDSISSLEMRLIFLADKIAEADAERASAEEVKNQKMIEVISAEKERDSALVLAEKQDESRALVISRIDKTSHDLDDALERAAALGEEISAFEEKIREKSNSVSTIEATIATLTEKLDELDREDQSLRIKLREKSDERAVYFTEFTKLDIKRASLGGEREKLTSRLFDEYELTYASAKELGYPEIDEKTRSRVQHELGKYKSRIRELGNVNVGAIEEYAKVKSEYDFLSAQIADLNESKAKYTSILSNIEREMCTRFTDTFNEINENFKTVFKDLFRGGSANLSLTDPANVLTSGIEIQVAPPGKVINNLKALSGGEQVFVAIAILFAIFKVNPPPFCLLDEIESALDEVNVVRFAEYARNYCDNTQFIVISHRRGTMETASSLYGVTMQERGVTSLLSVNVNEVESKIGIKA